MNFPILIKTIAIQDLSVQLCLVNDKPIVNFDGASYSQLWLLVQAMPILCDERKINEFAEIANFLWKGTEFSVVSSISSFQTNYIERVNFEFAHPADVLPYRVTDFALFDVSCMHSPKVEAGQLIFFVFNTSNGIPYRVVAPFPYVPTSTFVHYQILPILNPAIPGS